MVNKEEIVRFLPLNITRGRNMEQQIALLHEDIEKLQRQLDERGSLILRLRRELQKRTEQYNDLVDLAREKGVIGE